MTGQMAVSMEEAVPIFWEPRTLVHVFALKDFMSKSVLFRWRVFSLCMSGRATSKMEACFKS